MSDKTRTPDPHDGFSRRSFLKGSSAVAAATAVASSAAEGVAQEDGPKAVTKALIKLNVNGADREVTVEGRTTLLEVLRYQLDLTGAKPVSLDGSSGASTVLIDGKPVMASTTLAMAARNKKIQTVESLGGEKPDEVCTAFVTHDAEQCGFCTPGFVVAVRAFLDKNPKATEEEIRAGLNGNICRCGTYANVIDAAVSIAKGG